MRPVLPGRPMPPPFPATLLTGIFVTLFNFATRGQESRLGELTGKRIRICPAELPWALEVTVSENALRVSGPGESPHVTIRGSLADLGRLASRSEDPDTLFFERRLSIEGETDTGLLVKNMLDALDWDWEKHVRAVLPTPIADLAVLARARLREALRSG